MTNNVRISAFSCYRLGLAWFGWFGFMVFNTTLAIQTEYFSPNQVI
jgi:hypothetical protein